MPIYEYQCTKCGDEFEKIVKLNSPNPPCTKAVKTDSPKILVRCDGETKRIMSQSNFHLKGSCWAKDGYDKHYISHHPDALGGNDMVFNVENE